MPLRGLIYFAGLYQEYVSRNGYNLFGVKRIRLPAPQYIVFYNGLLEKPDKEVMHLSDAFYPEGSDKKHCLECEAVILNINRGHNPELLKKCKKLWEYTEFVSRMREYLQQGYELRTAASTVITECLRNGILVDVLTRCRTEVLEMLLTEYNEAETMEYLRKEAQEIGWAEGHAKGHAEGRAEGHAEGHAEGRAEGHAKGLEDGIKILVSVLQEEEIPQRRIVEKLIQKYSLSEEAAIQYVNHHEK